jgi:hypothetical protein
VERWEKLAICILDRLAELNARVWSNRRDMQRAHFRDPHGKLPRTPKGLPRHATAAVLRPTQAAVSGSVFPACVRRARRSVLLRAARPAETTQANNATEGIAAGIRSGCAPAMSARRRRRTTAFPSDHAMRLAHRNKDCATNAHDVAARFKQLRSNPILPRDLERCREGKEGCRKTFVSPNPDLAARGPALSM